MDYFHDVRDVAFEGGADFEHDITLSDYVIAPFHPYNMRGSQFIPI
jgi:hypothetical protein